MTCPYCLPFAGSSCAGVNAGPGWVSRMAGGWADSTCLRQPPPGLYTALMGAAALFRGCVFTRRHCGLCGLWPRYMIVDLVGRRSQRQGFDRGRCWPCHAPGSSLDVQTDTLLWHQQRQLSCNLLAAPALFCRLERHLLLDSAPGGEECWGSVRHTSVNRRCCCRWAALVTSNLVGRFSCTGSRHPPWLAPSLCGGLTGSNKPGMEM